MFFDEFDVDDVFNNYAKIMQDEGHLTKKANYVVPKSMLGDDKYTEVEIDRELRKIAADGGVNKLYGLFTDNLVQGAHPEGSPKIVDAVDNLGVVENLDATHKRMLDVAAAKVKLAQKVLRLANDLDNSGFISFAKNLDRLAGKIVGKKF